MLTQEQLIKERPDLLALAVKLLLATHTGKPGAQIDLVLPLHPNDQRELEQRELKFELADGAINTNKRALGGSHV